MRSITLICFMFFACLTGCGEEKKNEPVRGAKPSAEQPDAAMRDMGDDDTSDDDAADDDTSNDSDDDSSDDDVSDDDAADDDADPQRPDAAVPDAMSMDAGAEKAQWTCDRSWYAGGDTCDCGCGAYDPDCDTGAAVYGCTLGQTCNTVGECEGDSEWRCDPDFYGTEDGCDCGCGIYDPDCDDPTQTMFGCANFGATCNMAGECEGGTPAPPEWTCDVDAYGDGVVCNCACGTYDVDCGGLVIDSRGCESGQTCNTLGECVTFTPPSEWTCALEIYGANSACDCGCGAYDPDCDDIAAPLYGCEVGQYCGSAGACIDEAPPEWTCASTFYSTSDGCDCGCGTRDPDCDDPNQTFFNYCEVGETCNDAGQCEEGTLAPPEWTCAPELYGDSFGDDVCNCGCGIYDPNCDDPNNEVAGCEAIGQTCNNIDGVCTEDLVPDTWTCSPTSYGTADGCNCACGAYDPDCGDLTQQVIGCSGTDAGSPTCNLAGECEP